MAGAADRRHRDLRLPVRYWPVMLSGLAMIAVGRALGDDVAAMDAGARPHIDEPVGGADRLLVVLDDDDRVAEVAQPLQGREQALVVALVQPDRRLVEHVEHAGQARADLRGQPDALALAARQVPEARDRVRYSSPTFFRKPSRSLISFRMRWAISRWLGVSSVADAGEPVAGLGDRQSPRPG